MTLLLFSNLINEVFRVDPTRYTTVEIIENYNFLLNCEKYAVLNEMLASSKNDDDANINVAIFSEYDNDDLKELISKIQWQTSFELFKNVFSLNSKYMTAHQAKGLEWNKVVVAIEPTRNDKTTIANLFINQGIMQETSKDEFARIFYVGCSRAKEELYIHLKDSKLVSVVEDALSSCCADVENPFYAFFT